MGEGEREVRGVLRYCGYPDADGRAPGGERIRSARGDHRPPSSSVTALAEELNVRALTVPAARAVPGTLGR